MRAYNTDASRSIAILDRATAALTAKAEGSMTLPRAKDEALRCVEVIELFRASEDAFGTRGLTLVEAPRFEPLEISGVKVSIQPDLLVDLRPPNSRRRIGTIMFRLQKSPDPAACRLEETKQKHGENRREMARYMVAMMEMLLEDAELLAKGGAA